MAKKAKHKHEAYLNGNRFEDLVPDEALRRKMMLHLMDGKSILSPGSPFTELLQQTINDILEAEMEVFQEDEAAALRVNKRNGFTPKTVRSSVGDLHIHTPRDRNSDFSPGLIGKRVEQLHTGMDEQILAFYAQGNSIEDIRRLLQKLYQVEISAAKISAITDQIIPSVNAWSSRQLKSAYVVVYLDAMVFNVRSEGKYSSCASYTCYGVDCHGQRDILGFYFTDNEGSTAWGRVLEDLKSRGVEDILIVCIDGLKGFTAAIKEVYPQAIVQRCMVHVVRNVTRFVDDKDRKALHAQLRKVYKAKTVGEAEMQWIEFKANWQKKYPKLIKDWEEIWPELTSYFNFGENLRRMVYTTNPVEAVHRVIRKLIKGKAAWSSQVALTKQLYLSLMQNEKSWKRSVYSWHSVERELVSAFGDRFERHLKV